MAVQIVKQPVEALTVVTRHAAGEVLQRRVFKRLGVLLSLSAREKLVLHLVFENGQRLALDRGGIL